MSDPYSDQTNSPNADYGQSEGANSGDSDLNSLLNEYQEGTKPAVEKTVVQPDLSKLDPVIRFAEAEMQRTQRESIEKDVSAAVDRVAEAEKFQSLPKTLTRRMLVAYAFDNKDFDTAFNNREQNPAAWDAAIAKAQEELSSEVEGLNFASSDRDDIEAAKAAVDGVVDVSSDADDGPSAAELSNMSDTEWRRFIDEELSKVS
jgi:flagellar motility protein MotE (MotC chaperone)